MRKPVLVGVAAVMVLAIVVGAGLVAYSLAGVAQSHQAAMAVLESAREHNNAIHDSLTDPALAAELDNAATVRDAKAAMDDNRAKLGGGIRTVESQLVELRDERDKLRRATGDPLLFTGRSQLNGDRSRVEAATNAFESADHFLTTVDGHLRVFSAMLQALVEWDNINQFISNQDFSGALALMPQLKQQLQATATTAQGAQVPPPLAALISALTHAADDLNQALAAKQAGDVATVARLVPALQADAQTVSASYDGQAVSDYEHKLLDPYRARYESEMKRAGFVFNRS
ncbi:MAG TPA: hypothetical protein VF160_08465 [Candidatus Dormibacteraeota bacterium]